ncbi:MAG: OmpA family protein [Ignavibacteria bacterium]|nr:OmpA family protein [Ignavibacteria bacterium]
MRTITTLITLIVLMNTQNILSQSVENKMFNPLSNRLAVNFEGGATYPRTDFSDDQISYIGQFSLDYFFPSTTMGVFGLRGFGYYGQLNGSGTYANNSVYTTIPEYFTEIASAGAGLTYTLKASEIFYPYTFLGANYLYFNPKDINGNQLPRNKENRYGNISWSIIGELGSRFFVSNSVSFNIALNYNYLPIDNLEDVDNAISNGSQDDIFFTARAGLSFYFGGISDTDNDGVKDEEDLCPDTPPNVKVDQFGCAVDSDKDGVPDYLDKCHNTPKNISVNLDGCPLDVDGDGVPDYHDLCNDTPLGVVVDSRGCPLDSDDDGVSDYKDLCPNTPVGTEVNKWGCPVDEEVFEPIKKTEFILSGGINFEIGKTELLAVAYPELEKVLKVMRDYPETKWKIEGHTDNTGSQKLNRDLSINRAKSVYNYFISKDINSPRLSYNGYGPDYPISDNSTESGKALNRRVAIVLISDKENEAKDVIIPKETQKYNIAAERNIGKMIFTDGYLYCIQISSWRARAKAEGEAKRLVSEGYNAFIVIADLPDLDGIWYRVRVGYYNSLDEANKIREKVK